MDASPADPFGFAAEDDVPIGYMARTRDYYLAIGYDTPYRWAHHVGAPFQRLRRGLADSRVAIVTTAAPYKQGAGDQGPGAPYNGAAKFFDVYDGDSAGTHDLRISHIAYDRAHSPVTDMNAWFPLAALHRARAGGRIGAVGPRFYGAPTNRSHRVTIETDAPEILARCRADGIEAVVLVPNCPVCHQTVSLVARALEAGGIATVVMGCAKDIVEHVAVPRFLFSDFPLGNAAGRPHDQASQDATLAMALDLLDSATGACTTMRSPQVWAADAGWKHDYSNAARLPPEELASRRAEFERQKLRARAATA